MLTLAPAMANVTLQPKQSVDAVLALGILAVTGNDAETGKVNGINPGAMESNYLGDWNALAGKIWGARDSGSPLDLTDQECTLFTTALETASTRIGTYEPGMTKEFMDLSNYIRQTSGVNGAIGESPQKQSHAAFSGRPG